MKRNREYGMGGLLALALVLGGPACHTTPVRPAPVAGDLSSGQTRVPGQYLVTLVPGTDVKAITELYGRFGIKGIQNLSPNVFLMILTDDPGPSTVEDLRGRDARIKAVQPNFLYHANKPGDAR